jgi:spore germination protein YaaH
MRKRFGHAVLAFVLFTIAAPTYARKIALQESMLLGELADSYRVSVTTLIQTNDEVAQLAIRAGDTLTLPNGIRYQVRRGDTLSAIARRRFVSVDAIVKKNGWLRKVRLPAGLEITIPSNWPRASQRGSAATDLTEQIRGGKVALFRDPRDHYLVRDVAPPHAIRGRIDVVDDDTRIFFSSDVVRVPETFRMTPSVALAEIAADRGAVVLAEETLAVRLMRQGAIARHMQRDDGLRLLHEIAENPTHIDRLLKQRSIPELVAMSAQIERHRRAIQELIEKKSIVRSQAAAAKAARAAHAARAAQHADDIARLLRILPFL